MGRSSKTKARPRRQVNLKANIGPDAYEFTMQQEARNTEGRNRNWSTSQLRHKAIKFVGANRLPSDKPNDSCEQRNVMCKERDTVDREDVSDNPLSPDVSAENGTQPKIPGPASRLCSPSIEESSDDEIILFQGRNQHKNSTPFFRGQSKPVGRESMSALNHHRDLKSGTGAGPEGPARSCLDVADTTGSPSSNLHMSNLRSQLSHSTSMNDDEDKADADYIVFRPTSIGRRKQSILSGDDVDILADYIENIDKDYTEYATLSVKFAESEDAKARQPETRSLPLTSGDSSNADYPDSIQVNNTEQQTDQPYNGSCGDWTSQLGELDNYLDSTTDFDDIFLSNIEVDLQNLGDSECEEKAESSDRRRQARGKSWKLRNGTYSSALSFADALECDPYYGLDIMDFNRASLRKKTKGKESPSDFAISDSELELELKKAWQNDRNKKRSKKKERNELRLQGLLGRRCSNPDLKSKYPDGMRVEDLNLTLPPMDKQRRKLVHDLANALSLKSQSRGNGRSRFPVLYRTARTPKYTSKTVSHIEKIFSGSKFIRHAAKSWENQTSSKSVKARGGRGGHPGASVSYTDGDIVGASAPEIGAENKGRAMLEKMGWSTGTALGAINNKGILQPVAHVVKNTRIGLG
ncbi:hypothetical protein MPDQ_001266 [Monascus purpureus]|uniref:Protein SQS1 n=1 Tax=Monascus purpureus TaxID=5098 RepID=A0A507QRS1_MONPU|nr:hypothetical protein MPDQ_001266 [Monascus purpureus]